MRIIFFVFFSFLFFLSSFSLNSKEQNIDFLIKNLDNLFKELKNKEKKIIELEKENRDLKIEFEFLNKKYLILLKRNENFKKIEINKKTFIFITGGVSFVNKGSWNPYIGIGFGGFLK